MAKWLFCWLGWLIFSFGVLALAGVSVSAVFRYGSALAHGVEPWQAGVMMHAILD